MALSESVKKDIATGDVYAARALILDCLREDFGKPASSALTVSDFAAECFSNLYEHDDGTCPKKNPSECDETDWNRTRGLLKLNFSREKVKFLTELSPLITRLTLPPDTHSTAEGPISSTRKPISLYLFLGLLVFCLVLAALFRYFRTSSRDVMRGNTRPLVSPSSERITDDGIEEISPIH